MIFRSAVVVEEIESEEELTSNSPILVEATGKVLPMIA